MRIEFVQKIIDKLRKKQNSIKRSYIYIYKKQLCKLKNKIKNNEKIKVCFSVVYDSCFQFSPLFEKMLNDEIFEPFVLVIPDIARGEDNMFYQLDKTYKNLAQKYQNIKIAYDYDKKEFIDYSQDIDIMFFNNEYDTLTHELYRIQHNANLGILTCYTDYGYEISNWHNGLYNNCEYLSLWRIFALERYQLSTIQKNIFKGKNAILTGYAKMDRLQNYKQQPRERKKIIIAPHHTVDMEALSLSNFLTYSEFFIELFQKYPQIDFVFRPHPLLFVALGKDNLWGKEKIQKYIDKISAIPNVEYQNGGDYFDTFVNSDGLIHDCGSFMAEYLHTGHPCCYLLKDEKTNDKNLNAFAKECIKQHYKAYNKTDIINFIEEVILKNNDPMKQQRQDFYINNLKINYPNTTDFILNNLKKELTGE